MTEAAQICAPRRISGSQGREVARALASLRAAGSRDPSIDARWLPPGTHPCGLVDVILEWIKWTAEAERQRRLRDVVAAFATRPILTNVPKRPAKQGRD